MINEILYLHKYTMNLVKLNAINSTNEFLNDLVKDTTTENWTVVVAENQTKGKGQFQNKWQSEDGKNLTFSVLCELDDFHIDYSCYMNYVVSLAVFNVLKEYIPRKLKVKWPNDILSASKKICGILIENTVSKNKIVRSIIGIGLNINQEKFDSLPNASSLKLIASKEFDKNELLEKIVNELKKQTFLINKRLFEVIKDEYEANLYKKNVPSMYKDTFDTVFMGKILGVNQQGQLIVELENETIKSFGLKEIKFL